MKKIESINDLIEGQYVYLKCKIVDTNSGVINPICLQFTKNEHDTLTFTKDFIYRNTASNVELFTAEPSSNSEQLELPVVGKKYEFSDNRKYWVKGIFKGYITDVCEFKFIRPIQPPSEEEIKFLELAEKFKDKYEIKQKS